MEVLEQVKERPILFKGDMVTAILDGRKTQTRRVVKPQLGTNPYDKFVHVEATEQDGWYYWWDYICGPGSCDVDQEYRYIKCPYGKPGDELWVRETFSLPYHIQELGLKPSECHPELEVHYWADGDPESGDWTWPKPSIHMPRWASRIQLRVTDVHVERVQDISEEDAITEGVTVPEGEDVLKPITDARTWFSILWDNINAERGFGWNADPWVWVVEFERIKPV